MPASAHHFIPVWRSLDAEKTYRSKEYGPSRKRKRQPSQDDSDDEVASSPLIASFHSASLDLVDAEGWGTNRDPYHVAGHNRHLPVPGYPFPHAPLKEPRRDASAATAQRSLAALKPPLYVPPVTVDEDAKTSLRRHHLSVMTTIMHTSLLRGDYVRAGRAWGMILRTEVLGRSIDVRTHERWGIGAEILLRQHTERPAESLLEVEDGRDADQQNTISFTKEGFELAKSYYKRLVLQYPYQKMNPNLINDLDFLPAMYGLEIFEIQQRYKQAMTAVERTSASPSPYEMDEASVQGGEDGTKGSDGKAFEVKRSIADMAIDLATRMDEPMLSPPYNTYAPLLQLRAMVSLWIVDLIRDTMSLATKFDPKYETRLAKETERATNFVDTVKHQGGELPEFFVLNG